MISMLRSCRDLRPVCIILITLGAFYFVHLNRDKCSDSRCSVEDKPYVSPLCNCSKTIPVVNADALDNNRFRWCSIESDLRGHHQRVVTYSIYGNASDPVMFYRYYSLMKQISLNVEKQYPGWVIRFYHNFNETDHLAYTSLCDIYCRFDHVDLCSINDLERQIGNSTWPLDPALLRRLNKRMYRFLVMLDPQVDVFLSRDADSLIIPREVDAVHQWLQSNYTFHLMRDHPAHLGIMLAGMWGAKVNQSRNIIEGAARSMILAGQDDVRIRDQATLADILWPAAKFDIMAHDSYHCEAAPITRSSPLKVFPFPTRRDGGHYIGGPVDHLTNSKCPVACRPPDHQDWEFC